MRRADLDAAWGTWRQLLFIAALACAGCGGASVAVPTSFPVPLVSSVPLTIGVHLKPELLEYVHEETIDASGDWRIELGGAQGPMFNNLLSGMFAGVEPVANPAAPGGDVAGVLVPIIEELQFTIPAQTRTEYFEVWIRYQFKLHGRDGELLAEFPLTAYGKANQRNYGLQSTTPALQAAALAACRDAMAAFTVMFYGVPPVQSWLAAELGGTST